MNSITMLLNRHGNTMCVFATSELAQAKCDAFNSDPWIEEGTPDMDAPYSIATWGVCHE